jgi:NitT/TauT family transport system substrate-binding protein
VEARLVGAPLLGVPFLMIARPEIPTVADLKGHAVGITRPGALSDRLTRLTLERFGLRANDDVALRPIGGSQPERYQAMVAGVIEAATLPPPLDAQARHDGLNVIYDLADLGVPFVYSSVVASNRTIAEQPQLVQRFVAAMVESVQVTERNPELARAALRRVLEIQDADILDAAYAA